LLSAVPVVSPDCPEVIEVPETRYARTNDGVHIAYQVVGDGPPDVALVDNWSLPLEAKWEHPVIGAVFRRLASLGRLICFDKRGIGCSDSAPLEASSTIEAWMDDLGCVLDASRSERPWVLGATEGAQVGVLFAATNPDRCSGLVLVNLLPEPQMTEATAKAYVELFDFNSPHFLEIVAPTIASQPELARWWGTFARLQASPATQRRLREVLVGADIRGVLRSIRVPTLVLNRVDRVGNPGEDEAANIDGARYVELKGADHYWWVGNANAVLDEVEEFLTGDRPEVEVDRVLATLLFTDIVSSTKHAARLGDKRWAAVLDQHDALVARELANHRGCKVNPTGDGILATFDGPARAVRCAQAICSAVQSLGIEVRAGLHTGEVELRGDDIGGIAVHIGQRVCSVAGPGEVLVTRTVTDLVAGSGIEFDDRGERELKGIPGVWRLFVVAG